MFKTHTEIYHALLDGKKLHNKSWSSNVYTSLVDGLMKLQNGLDGTVCFSSLNDWEIWKDLLECTFGELEVGEKFTHSNNPGNVYMKIDDQDTSSCPEHCVIVIEGKWAGNRSYFPLNEVVKRVKAPK